MVNKILLKITIIGRRTGGLSLGNGGICGRFTIRRRCCGSLSASMAGLA